MPTRSTGKFNKTKRGGGRSFSRDMVLDSNGIAVSKASRDKNVEEDEDEDDALEEEDEEEDEEEEAVIPTAAAAAAQPEMSRVERRELKKKQAAQKQAVDKDDEDADLINPNHVEKKLNISDLGSAQLSRKEREAKEKQEAKDNYWKLHRAGKTDEAKSDLARLKKIREEREAAQAKRKAEAEAKEAEQEKKKAAMNGKRA